MLHRVFLTLFVAVNLVWLVDSASAQVQPNGTVSASGRCFVQATPNKFRMQVELRGYGSTVEAALKNLKARRDATTVQLKKLNVDSASICFSTLRAGTVQAMNPPAVMGYAVPAYSVGPVVSSTGPIPPPTYAPSSSYAPPLATVTPELPGPPTATPSPAPPSSSWSPAANPIAKRRPALFVAATTLKAEWPLQGVDADAIVAAAEAIRQQATAADLTGSKATRDQLSPEERELAEEAEMGPPRPPVDPSSPWASPSGSSPMPTFFYVAVLSDKQRKAMLADACAAAKKDAAELAEAAGIKLGRIANLQGSFSDFDMQSAATMFPSRNEREAVATTPDGLAFVCAVHISYYVLPPGDKP